MDISYLAGEPMDVGPGPHLFLDDHVVEDRWALTRSVNQPYRYLGNPVLIADRAWEERPYRPQVFYDEALGRYRMYYQCFNGTNYWTRQGPSYYTCYAESDDCISWEKPEWTHSPFGESKATNIIRIEGREDLKLQAAWVFPNRTSTDPDKAWCMTYDQAGLRLAYSPDGLRWRDAREEPLFHYHSDTMNHIVWNEALGKYMLYMRPPTFAAGVHEGPGRRHYRRRTGVMLSENLLTWTSARMVLHPDELDPPDFDSTHVFRYGDRYIALTTYLHHEEGATNDVTISTSRDGFNWTRALPRELWLSRGREGDFDAGCVSVASDPVVRGMDLWFYYSGFPQRQTVFEQEAAIGLVKLMKDRFMSFEAPADDYGYLLTKEFVFRGKGLSINCRMKHGDRNTFGELKAEILKRPNDADPAQRMGAIIPGHGLEDCDLIRSNAPNQIVKWNGNGDLSELDGQPVYLRFRLRNGGLFAFEMVQ